MPISSDKQLPIINPLSWTPADLPKIVFESDRGSFFGWLIQDITKGVWNHAMMATQPGAFSSMQFNGFHEDPMTDDMDKTTVLKFYSINSMTAAQWQTMLSVVAKKLATQKSFWSYNYLGLVGQALHIPQITNPFQEFCSEEVADILRQSMGWDIPLLICPNLLEAWCADNPDKVTAIGIYQQTN
jgi:hypothetical protein